MIVPLVLLLLSTACLVATLAFPEASALLVVAGPCVLASLFLLLRGYRSRARRAPNMIVIDGSNAMHWKDGTPLLATLREVVHRLSALGYTPGIIFDANAGYILTGRYQHNRAMGKLLGLPRDRVIVVPKGTPADPTILAAARFLDARILTNDRYRDWADQYPELRNPGHLIQGGYRNGTLWLDVEQSESRRSGQVRRSA